MARPLLLAAIAADLVAMGGWGLWYFSLGSPGLLDGAASDGLPIGVAATIGATIVWFFAIADFGRERLAGPIVASVLAVMGWGLWMRFARWGYIIEVGGGGPSNPILVVATGGLVVGIIATIAAAILWSSSIIDSRS
jgi:hypothetical protein